MEGEESWKKEYNGDDQKLFLEKIWGTSDDEEDDFGVKKYQISEEAVVEMMRWLANEIGLGGSPPPSPSQETTLATVNGNEESCGPSFSGPASSVMASIDTSGVAGGSCFGGGTIDPAPLFWPWNESSVEDGGHWEPPACAITAADEEDEDWVALVLDGPAFDPEEDRG